MIVISFSILEKLKHFDVGFFFLTIFINLDQKNELTNISYDKFA